MTGDQIDQSREWTVIRKRPPRMGWPNIAATRLSNGQVYGLMPKLIRVRVTQMHGQEAQVVAVSVRGTWVSNRHDSGWRRLGDGSGCWVPAPDWVGDIAMDILADVRPEDDRGFMVLGARLDALFLAINAQDWDDVQFQYDRVRSQASKMSGERGREYDPPAEVIR